MEWNGVFGEPVFTLAKSNTSDDRSYKCADLFWKSIVIPWDDDAIAANRAVEETLLESLEILSEMYSLDFLLVDHADPTPKD